MASPPTPVLKSKVIATLRLNSRWKSFAVQENWLDIAWAAAHQHDKEERHILQNAGNFFHALQCEFRAFQRRC